MICVYIYIYNSCGSPLPPPLPACAGRTWSNIKGWVEDRRCYAAGTKLYIRRFVEYSPSKYININERRRRRALGGLLGLEQRAGRRRTPSQVCVTFVTNVM